MAKPHQEQAGVHIPWKQPEQATRHSAAVGAGKKRRKDYKKVELRKLGKMKAKRVSWEALPIHAPACTCNFRCMKTLSELQRNCSCPCI